MVGNCSMWFDWIGAPKKLQRNQVPPYSWLPLPLWNQSQIEKNCLKIILVLETFTVDFFLDSEPASGRSTLNRSFHSQVQQCRLEFVQHLSTSIFNRFHLVASALQYLGQLRMQLWCKRVKTWKVYYWVCLTAVFSSLICAVALMPLSSCLTPVLFPCQISLTCISFTHVSYLVCPILPPKSPYFVFSSSFFASHFFMPNLFVSNFLFRAIWPPASALPLIRLLSSPPYTHSQYSILSDTCLTLSAVFSLNYIILYILHDICAFLLNYVIFYISCHGISYDLCNSSKAILRICRNISTLNPDCL